VIKLFFLLKIFFFFFFFFLREKKRCLDLKETSFVLGLLLIENNKRCGFYVVSTKE
jgi:hypothetical protein